MSVTRYRSRKSELVYEVIAEPTTWKTGKALVVFQCEISGAAFVMSSAEFFSEDEFKPYATLDDLHPQQRFALLEFKEWNGDDWKEALNAAWCTGNYKAATGSGWLQSIRNEHGPVWLDALVI